MKKAHVFPIRRIALSAMLAAASIVLGKLLAFNIGDTIRISFENLPILFAGLYLGPLYGIAVGAVADLIGCVIVGYAINPVITLGAAAVGATAGLVGLLIRQRQLRSWTAVFTAHLIGSVLIKTAGLSAFYGQPYPVLLWTRFLTYLIVIAAEGAILSFLASNGAFQREIMRLLGKESS